MARYAPCAGGRPVDGIISFVPGSEIVQPFLVVADQAIVDIAGGTVTAEVLADDAVLIALAVGAGVDILDPAPAPADDQQPHGVLRLTEVQTAAIPDGAVLRLIYTQDDVTMPALGWLLQRLP